MGNTRAMSIQMPEETYQRMKAYLKRHGMKQKEFIELMLRRALEYEADTTDSDVRKVQTPVSYRHFCRGMI